MSVVVALLTTLRLYAILRAIAYYRFLRRFNDLNRNFQHQHQLNALRNTTSEKQQQAATLQGFIAQSGAGPDLMRSPILHQQHNSNVWSAHQQQPASMFSPNHHVISSPRHMTTVSNQQQQQASSQHEHYRLLSPTGQQMATFVSCQVADGLKSANEQLNNALKFGSLRAGPTVVESSPMDGASTFTLHPDQNASSSKQLSATENNPQPPTVSLAVRTDDQNQQQPSKTLIKVAASHASQQQHQTNQRPSLLILSTTNPDRHRQRQQQLKSSTPDVLLVKGRPHRLVAARRELQRRDFTYLSGDSSGDTAGNGFESEPVVSAMVRDHRRLMEARTSVTTQRRRRSRSRDDELPSSSFWSPPIDRSIVSDQDLLDSNNNSSRSLNKNNPELSQQRQQTSFTLLSASQLERLGKKLLANETGGQSGPSSGSKYKVVGRYRSVRKSDLEERHRKLDEVNVTVEDEDEEDEEKDTEQLQREHARRHKERFAPVNEELRRVVARGRGGGNSSGTSSSGLATDSDDALTATGGCITLEELANSSLTNSKTLATRRRKLAQSLFLRRSHENDGKVTSDRRQQRQSSVGCKRARGSLASLRQTEEFQMKPPAAMNRDLLLGKCEYLDRVAEEFASGKRL